MRLQHTSDVGERAIRLGQVVQHQRERRGIEPAVVNRQRLEVAASELDVLETLQPLLRCLQHRSRRIHRDDPAYERGEGSRHLSSAAAEVADRPVGVGECRQRCQVRALAEQIVAHPVPLSGRRREKFLRLGAALGKHRLHPPLIVDRRRRWPDLVAHERPQPARR